MDTVLRHPPPYADKNNQGEGMSSTEFSCKFVSLIPLSIYLSLFGLAFVSYLGKA